MIHGINRMYKMRMYNTSVQAMGISPLIAAGIKHKCKLHTHGLQNADSLPHSVIAGHAINYPVEISMRTAWSALGLRNFSIAANWAGLRT